MADEPVVIEATAGPYAGQRLSVAAADAKKAISEGWARDPFAAPGEVKKLTADERFAMLQKAEAAATRLRGGTVEEPAAAEEASAAKAPKSSK